MENNNNKGSEVLRLLCMQSDFIEKFCEGALKAVENLTPDKADKTAVEVAKTNIENALIINAKSGEYLYELKTLIEQMQ